MTPYTPTPEPGDVDVFAAFLRWIRSVAEGLLYTTPFIGPAFLGAVLSATRKSYRDKGVFYWISAVMWSTAAGAILTPAFAKLAGLDSEVAGSSAALVALLGHEGVGWLCGHFKPKEPWDGSERRKQR